MDDESRLWRDSPAKGGVAMTSLLNFFNSQQRFTLQLNITKYIEEVLKYSFFYKSF